MLFHALSPFAALFLLIGWHALADYTLQGDFLAQGKNRYGVAIITGSTILGFVEVVAHALIDFLKCENRLSIEADQVLHIACKCAYVVALALFPRGVIG